MVQQDVGHVELELNEGSVVTLKCIILTHFGSCFETVHNVLASHLEILVT